MTRSEDKEIFTIETIVGCILFVAVVLVTLNYQFEVFSSTADDPSTADVSATIMNSF